MANKNFYNVTLKNFVAPWTSRDRSVFVPLNDYTATVIGMVRDDVDFSTVLSADLLYVGNAAGAPAYSPANNDHYQYLDDNNVDLKASLKAATQSGLLGLPVAATAGVMTTRTAAAAFFVAGTNRAMFRFTMINFMCRDLEQLQDSSLPPDRIRQDVSRSPGGDSRVFLNSCITCHDGMDPLAQAFAYYNFDATAGRLALHRRRRAAEVPDQFRQLQVWIRHHRRSLGQLLPPRRQPGAGLRLRPAGYWKRRQVDGPGIGAQRRLRAVPGGEGVPHGVPARSGQRRGSTESGGHQEPRSSPPATR